MQAGAFFCGLHVHAPGSVRPSAADTPCLTVLTILWASSFAACGCGEGAGASAGAANCALGLRAASRVSCHTTLSTQEMRRGGR